jgi:glycosyltransferase involved in cell wall biosynthesis
VARSAVFCCDAQQTIRELGFAALIKISERVLMSPTISAVVTTFNSAATLARCLQSAAFCDELIVLDSHSSDATPDIARAHGAQLYAQTFKGFAAQKTDAIALAKMDWVLLLDSDEYLDQHAADLIRLAISDVRYAGYRLPRMERIFWRYQHPGTRANTFVRIFRRDRARISQHAVHESVLVDGTVGALRCAIWHDSDIDIAVKVDKLNRYSSLALSDWRGKRAPPAWRLTLYPLWYFFRAYVLKRQFLNGWAGYINAVSLAHYAFLKYAKRLESHKNKRPD